MGVFGAASVRPGAPRYLIRKSPGSLSLSKAVQRTIIFDQFKVLHPQSRCAHRQPHPSLLGNVSLQTYFLFCVFLLERETLFVGEFARRFGAREHLSGAEESDMPESSHEPRRSFVFCHHSRAVAQSNAHTHMYGLIYVCLMIFFL